MVICHFHSLMARKKKREMRAGKLEGDEIVKSSLPPPFFSFSERRTLFYATKWFLIIDYVEMGGNRKGKEKKITIVKR